MLEEKKYIDKIEILNNCIQVREKLLILKNGNIIASNFNRYIIEKENSLNIIDPFIKKIAQLLWEDEVEKNFYSGSAE